MYMYVQQHIHDYTDLGHIYNGQPNVLAKGLAKPRIRMYFLVGSVSVC